MAEKDIRINQYRKAISHIEEAISNLELIASSLNHKADEFETFFGREDLDSKNMAMDIVSIKDELYAIKFRLVDLGMI